LGVLAFGVTLALLGDHAHSVALAEGREHGEPVLPHAGAGLSVQAELAGHAHAQPPA
jgi:hypothetical protein